jgi:small-conductance mechanosensitive channel
MSMPETAEELCQKPDIQKELRRTGGDKQPREKVKARGVDKFWFVTHALLVVAGIALLWVLGAKLIPLPQPQIEFLHRLVRAGILVIATFAIAKAISVYALGRIEDAAIRFTLRRILHLLVVMAVVFIAFTALFINWYPALTALGIGSIIIGLAVQTPMKSFIAWIYILVRQPFRVGDRIKIGDATGDVIDVSYLDTTLWEFGGHYISGDHPSGRIIKFPNEKVLDEIVWNYSWPLFPYIWNEIKFQIAYQSDLKFVSETMQRIVTEDLGKEMLERVATYRELLARTPVDELEVREHPRVIFRVDEVTWIDAIVRYLVSPREAGPTKSRLIPKLLAALNEEPNKVMFPKGDAR